VIGGGATGTGVVRDLAMRGFDALLVEKRDLTHGTTGRYHGLLHSGGRYVVKDTQAAVECIQENRILRRIMPHCLEDTGGFFVVTPWDDPEYAPRFLEGCHQAGIPVEEVPTGQMLREEPLLNPDISRCFRVPDAAADSFLAADLNAESARQYGARVWTYHEVVKLLGDGYRVVGALCHDLVKDEEVTIHADMIVNAAGAWSGKIAATVGLRVHILPSKGTMIAINHRVLNTVVNRCKMPSDGDIIVPAHTVAIIGTTDERVSDPEQFAIEPWEIQLMLDEGEKLIPNLKHMRILRAWAGVRPLYQETEVADLRDATRAYALLDHEMRDGVAGVMTITGGKWTTYRLMAQATVDRVCEKLDARRECRTHLEALPDGEKATYHQLGAPLARVEGAPEWGSLFPRGDLSPQGTYGWARLPGRAPSPHGEHAPAYGELICECELATRADVERAITAGQAKSIDDVRRDVRLGMGPCQGGFCTYRAAGILHALRRPPIQEINVALRDFLQERWKGLLPILWGQQLRQERLDELIYLNVLNTDHLPGPKASRLGPVMYEPPPKGEGAERR
jgi:glycerol-3-phosphate dehydrogenase